MDHRGEQYALVGTCQAVRIHSPQATIVVNQVAKDGFKSALPDPPQALNLAHLRALPRPLIGDIVNGLGESFAQCLGAQVDCKRYHRQLR